LIQFKGTPETFKLLLPLMLLLLLRQDMKKQ